MKAFDNVLCAANVIVLCFTNFTTRLASFMKIDVIINKCTGKSVASTTILVDKIYGKE